MADVTMSQVGEIMDPKLRKVLTRVVRQAELAIEKVAVNHAQPTKFPISADQKSVEQVFLSRFATLQPKIKQKAATNSIDRINQPPAVRTARFGDLATIDLTKSVAVDAQAEARPFPPGLKLPPDHLKKLKSVHTNVLVVPPGGLVPQQTTNKLEFRIHKVRCLDETDGFLGSEAGDDEIDLGGTTVDESGDTNKVAPFRVGSDFDDNEEKVFSPPRRFTMFNLTEGTEFPKSYFVTLVPAEIDMGGLPEFLDKLLKWVKEKVISALTAALGGVIGASGGPIGAIIGAAVGWAVGEVWAFFKKVWEDDVFSPVTTRVNIPSLTARWAGGKTDGPEGIALFSGHGGKYQITYDWRMFA